MTKIHPSAIIHRGAELDSDVDVGPGAVIGEHVKLAKGSRILPYAIVEGHTTIGENNEIGPYCVIGGKPQDLKYKNEPTRLVIGNNNIFRESVTVNVGTVTGNGVTTIGNHCLVMAYCHVAHDCILHDHVIMANYTGLCGHVVLEDWVILSGNVGVTQFLRIGKHAFVGGMSAIRKDLAPYTTVVGNPLEIRGVNIVGLKRRGFSAENIKAVVEAHNMFFHNTEGRETAEIIDAIDARFPSDEYVRYFVNFLRSSKNGISR